MGVSTPRIATVHDMVVHHRPANQQKECRGSCRANYIKLLKLGVEEDPTDSRRSYYYGRELFFDGQWEKVRRAAERHAQGAGFARRLKTCNSAEAALLVR